MCQGRSTPYVGDGRPLTFNDGILIMGPYKHLRTWVVEFPIPYYMEIMGVDRPHNIHMDQKISHETPLQLNSSPLRVGTMFLKDTKSSTPTINFQGRAVKLQGGIRIPMNQSVWWNVTCGFFERCSSTVKVCLPRWNPNKHSSGNHAELKKFYPCNGTFLIIHSYCQSMIGGSNCHRNP